VELFPALDRLDEALSELQFVDAREKRLRAGLFTAIYPDIYLQKMQNPWEFCP
jgi:hypothetical protein